MSLRRPTRRPARRRARDSACRAIARKASRGSSAASSSGSAERLELHVVRGRVLVERLDPARHDTGRRRRRRRGEDRCDGVRVVDADESALEQQVDEIRRLRRAAHLPLGASASADLQQRPDLLENGVDLVGCEALALHGVPTPALAHAEREAAGHDPLVVRSERPERVRVFGDLAQHGIPFSRSRPYSVTSGLQKAPGDADR